MTSAAPSSRLFTIKQILVPLMRHPRVAFGVKWFVYLSLLWNFGLYVEDDMLAYAASFPNGAPLAEILESFATTIDVAAWILLIAVFELETHVLPDEAFNRFVNWLFQTIKILCYLSIGYAAYGYMADTLDLYQLIPLGHQDSLCNLVGQGLSLQMDAQDFAAIEAGACAQLPAGAQFFQVQDEMSIISALQMAEVRAMGWLDFFNAAVWIIVVILIDVEVHLQSTDKFGSKRLNAVRTVKTLGYLLLISACLIWMIYGYGLYTWDAFLWIFGFWAIELNLAEWEQERLDELSSES